jgi:uncharacterized protein
VTPTNQSHETEFREQLTFPIGTHILTRREIRDAETDVWLPLGAVGMIVESPEHANGFYRVQFPGGAVVSLRRKDFAVRKHVRRETLQGDAPAPEALYQHVQYRCVVGSQAYGLADENSDVDRRGFYLAPADLQWSLDGAPEQLENDAAQETYWELQKFIMMALKANPNILECLYTPLQETVSPLAAELLAMRRIFLSRLIYQTYNGYVLSQFKKIEQDLRTKGEPRWKHAMHLIRLLIAGIVALRDGEVPVRVAEHRDQLLTIKRGEMNWLELNKWRLALHTEFDEIYTKTALPDQPDYARANAFLIKARRSMVE